MACNAYTLSALLMDCAKSKGGIKNVYLANFDDVVSAEPGTEGDKEKIATITMKEGAKFKKFYFRPNTSSHSDALTRDDANGVNYVTSTVSLVFTRQDTTKRIAMTALCVNDLAVIVEEANGFVTYLTKDAPAVATEATGDTGTAAADGNKYTITLSADNETFPYEVTAKALASVIETDPVA